MNSPISELVLLWEDIMADGKVSKNEIRSVSDWLHRHVDSEDEDIRRIQELFREIRADKSVSKEELVELDRAIKSLAQYQLAPLADVEGEFVANSTKLRRRRDSTPSKKKKKGFGISKPIALALYCWFIAALCFGARSILSPMAERHNEQFLVEKGWKKVQLRTRGTSVQDRRPRYVREKERRHGRRRPRSYAYTVDGQEYQKSTRLSAIGQFVYYDPKHPKTSRLENDNLYSRLSLGSLVFGITMVVLGPVCFVMQVRNVKKGG